MSTIRHQYARPTRHVGRAAASIGLVIAAALAATPSAHAQAIDAGSVSQAMGSLATASSMLSQTEIDAGDGTSAGAASLEAETNVVRRAAGVPAWTHSDEMQTLAQRWAEHLVAEKAIYHQRITNGGENITCGTGPVATAQRVVGGWLGEVAPNDGHRRNLLETRMTTMGYGVAASGGYWCVVLDAR